MRQQTRARPLPRAMVHLMVIGLVASTAALGIVAARTDTSASESARSEPSSLSFNLIGQARAAGGTADLRSVTFELVPEPTASDPIISRRAARFEATPKPTPLPTPVAPPPAAPDPTPAPVAAAPAPQPPAGNGTLAWPVTGGTISQYYHAGHLALDVAAPYGTTVMAANGGVVTYAGWRNNGGGYVVAIDHGNGMQTLYNHLGSIWVSPGQAVARGQGIAGVGCTGICTGPHVHFEVIVNGVIVNPLRYL